MKDPKTNKQVQIAKKFTEEDEITTTERHKLLVNLQFLNEWGEALTRQYNAYRDMITMIQHQRQQLFSQLEALGKVEPVQGLETEQTGQTRSKD